MPGERLSMRKIREVLRLRFAQGLSQRAIGQSLGVSPPGCERTANAGPVLLHPKPAPPKPRRPARPERWEAAITELLALQAGYAAWLEALPEATRASATGEALQAIVDLDPDELAAIQPPRGFGRD